jgi:hypothetical protein
MRANNRVNSFKYAFVLAPLLAAGCGGSGGTGGTISLPGGLTFPDCTEGQLIGTDNSGKLSCLNAPSGKVDFPSSCGTNQAFNSDGSTVTCVDKAVGGGTNPLNTKIDTLIKTTDDLTTKATAIKNGSGKVPTFAGVTDVTTNGNMAAVAGVDNGLAGGTKLCTDKYGAGAHMCSMNEIYMSAVQGVINSTKNIVSKAWIWAPSWTSPLGTGFNGTLGYGDNCGTYTYPTGDKQWSGIAVSTGANEQTTRWGIRFHGGADARCSATLPVACCK